MAPHVAAVGWLATHQGGAEREHLALPSDLYMVTVHGVAHRGTLDMAVTLLRTRCERFRSQGPGELAFALLRPRGLLMLLRAPLHGRTDGRIGLDAFCSADEHRWLQAQLLAAPDPSERMRRFGRWLEDRIARRHGLRDAQTRVAQAADWLYGEGVPARWPELGARLGISQRQLERDFRTWLGISPAGYARLLRFQRTAQGLAAGERLADAANAHCYFDQAHMTRNCKTLSTMTPRELAAAAAPPARQAERRALAGRVLVVDAPARSACAGRSA